MAVRGLFFTLGTAWPVLACSCTSYERVQACQIYQSTPVIFRGRAIDHFVQNTTGHLRMVMYRFKVLETFKGLPPDMKEVFIDPASRTPCYSQFALDRDYLVYTGAGPPALAAGTAFGELPAAWKGLEQLPVYAAGICNPTRAVEEKDTDLAFLRSQAKDSLKVNGWIEGRAVQNFSGWPSLFAEFVAAAEATVTISSPSGDRKTAAVQADGRYKIGSVPPGIYTISVESQVLGNGTVAKPNVEIPSGGCVVANAWFSTGSTIAGRVLAADGKPASRIRLELGELQTGGKVRVIPSTWSNTDKDGNFKIPNAPVGRIVLAANLNRAPTPERPFDPTYVPGTQDVSAARVFAIRPGQQVTDVSLRLPGSLPFGDLYVDVKWPDGSPALHGARAVAEWNGARADFQSAPKKTNRVKLRLALERRYKIKVDWADTIAGEFLVVEGEAQTVDFTRDGQMVGLPLKGKRPH